MNTTENIERLIDLVTNGSMRTPYAAVGVIKSVNKDERTCSIAVNDELTIENCRLNAVIDSYDNHVLILPKVNSAVLYEAINGELTDVVVLAHSAIDMVEIVVGEQSLVIDQNEVVINGGSETSANATELKKQLGIMSARIDTIVNAITVAVPAATDGGLALQKSMLVVLEANTNTESFDKITDDKLKH